MMGLNPWKRDVVGVGAGLAELEAANAVRKDEYALRATLMCKYKS